MASTNKGLIPGTEDLERTWSRSPTVSRSGSESPVPIVYPYAIFRIIEPEKLEKRDGIG